MHGRIKNMPWILSGEHSHLLLVSQQDARAQLPAIGAAHLPLARHQGVDAAASQTPGGASRCMPWGTGTAEMVMVSPPGELSVGFHSK